MSAVWARHKINAKMFETQAKPIIWLDGGLFFAGGVKQRRDETGCPDPGRGRGPHPALCAETGEIMGFTPMAYAGGQDDR